jgi:hypothetical protein
MLRILVISVLYFVTEVLKDVRSLVQAIKEVPYTSLASPSFWPSCTKVKPPAIVAGACKCQKSGERKPDFKNTTGVGSPRCELMIVKAHNW